MDDHPPALVVRNDDHDGKPLADRRVELHEIEADGSVADDEEDAAFGMAELCRVGEGDPDREAAVADPFTPNLSPSSEAIDAISSRVPVRTGQAASGGRPRSAITMSQPQAARRPAIA